MNTIDNSETMKEAQTHTQVSFKIPTEARAMVEKLAKHEQRSLGPQVTFLFNTFILPELENLLSKYTGGR